MSGICTSQYEWQLDFPATFGTAGTSTILFVTPEVDFQGVVLMATDTGTPLGYGSSIGAILVGNQLQRPALTSTLTEFFGPKSRYRWILEGAPNPRWDRCDKALSISVTVNFIQTCTFYMSVFGNVGEPDEDDIWQQMCALEARYAL